MMPENKKRRTERIRRLLVGLCSALVLFCALAVNTYALDLDNDEVYQTLQLIQPNFFVASSVYLDDSQVGGTSFTFSVADALPRYDYEVPRAVGNAQFWRESPINDPIYDVAYSLYDSVSVVYEEVTDYDMLESLHKTQYDHFVESYGRLSGEPTLGYGSYCTFNNILYDSDDDRFILELPSVTHGGITDTSGFYSYKIEFVNLSDSFTPIVFESDFSDFNTEHVNTFTFSDVFDDYYDGVDYTGDLIYINSFSVYYMDLNDLPMDEVIRYTLSVTCDASMLERNAGVIDVLGERETPFFTTLKDAISTLALEVYRGSFDMFTTDYVGWLGTAVGGFFSLELLPFISLGGILSIIIMIALVIAFLKVFMGG